MNIVIYRNEDKLFPSYNQISEVESIPRERGGGGF